MYTLEKIKTDLATLINQKLGAELVQAADIAYPPNKGMGDLSLPCFVIAKNTGKNPAEVAESLVAALSDDLSDDDSNIATIATAGPYLNFKIAKAKLLKNVFTEIKEQKEKYGHNEVGEKQKTMIEFSNANTHKEFHVGHLRNLCYGDSVHKLMLASDYDSIPVSYINDFGIHVAKTLWAYLEFYKGVELPENKGYFLGQVYVRSNKETKEKPHLKDMVNFMMRKIESRDGEEYKLWQKTRLWSIEQMGKIYEEMGIKFEKTYYESEVIDEGRLMVNDLLKKGVLKESEGAVIADMEDIDLGVLVVLRSDGSATYPVADLPLAMQKFKDYDLDASIYVVDVRQELYFKQLFYILSQIGYKKPMIHLGYDFVTLPDGMMSSRSGNVVTYEELKEMLHTKLSEETLKRHEDWTNEKIQKNISKIANAVIKFEMLKVGAKQTIIFDIDQAMSFQGFTATYLLYTVARINSIIKKSGIEVFDDIDYKVLQEEKEHNINLKLAKYPDILKLATKNFDPSVVAKYLFELAQEFSDYYHAVPVLKAKDEEVQARVAMLVSVKQVLENGLGLLGIEAVEEM